MKRFIRYLYEYEQGQRMRNVGFVKVEQGDGECIVHIHGKGLRLEGSKELELFLFFEKDGECLGVSQGVIENVNPAVNYQLYFTAQDTGEPENFSLVDGIIMENSAHRKYAAVWDDMPVNVNSMRRWMRRDEHEAVKEKPAEQEKPVEEAEPGERPEPGMEALELCEETARESALVESQPEETAPDIVAEETQPAEEEAGVEPCRGCGSETCGDENQLNYTKIQRKDIARLPRCEWKLSNNSFLLHGYYNYHHLLFIDDGEALWLGVPGVYHEKEARVAGTFGFPRFIRLEESTLDLGEDECNKEDDFGYWCRRVRRDGI